MIFFVCLFALYTVQYTRIYIYMMMMPAQTMQALQKTPFEGCAEMNIQKECCFLFYPYTDHITVNLMFSKTDFFWSARFRLEYSFKTICAENIPQQMQ